MRFELKNLKPRIYKKTLFIGKVKIFKFTKDYTKKFFHKALWILLITAMLLGMVLGGVGIMMNNGSISQNTSQPQIVIPSSGTSN